MKVNLLYFIQEDTSIPGGQIRTSTREAGQILQGSSSNSANIKFSNYLGTQIDFLDHRISYV